jgi:hypothetical protein
MRDTQNEAYKDIILHSIWAYIPVSYRQGC